MSWTRVLEGSRSALLVGLLLGASSLAAADAQDPPEQGLSTVDSEALLRDRHRETLHPGEPLRIVGLEQGDNDFRARTPALVRSDRAALQVDPDEQYERRLAAYTNGSTFHRPLPANPVTPGAELGLPGTPVPGTPVNRGSAGEVPAEQSFTTRYLGPAALLFMLIAAGLLARTHLRPAAPLTTSAR